MYHVVGLTQDGEMVLNYSGVNEPTMDYLEETTQAFGYVQLLILSGGGQCARFEINPTPKLKQVDLL